MLLDKIELGSDERVIRIVRKHWFVLCAEITGLVIVWITPIVALLTFPLWKHIFPATIPLDILNGTIRSFFGALWTLVLGSVFFHNLTDYYLDVWIITTERIVAIDQRGLFKRSIASVRLERLQNLDVTINGIIATMLDFGTLRVESAAHDHDFVIRGIPSPREIKSLILAQAESRNASEPQITARY